MVAETRWILAQGRSPCNRVRIVGISACFSTPVSVDWAVLHAQRVGNVHRTRREVPSGLLLQHPTTNLFHEPHPLPRRRETPSRRNCHKLDEHIAPTLESYDWQLEKHLPLPTRSRNFAGHGLPHPHPRILHAPRRRLLQLPRAMGIDNRSIAVDPAPRRGGDFLVLIVGQVLVPGLLQPSKCARIGAMKRRTNCNKSREVKL